MQSFNEYKFESNVTFFIGNNGSGKSTLLEAI
ncbi:AAA family ATPase, partial [Paenibacillus sp. TAF58]